MYLETEFDYVDIVYENCDCIRIPADLIENIFIGNLTPSLESYSYGKIHPYYKCSSIKIELLEAAGKLFTLNDNRYYKENGNYGYNDYTPVPFFEHVNTAPSTTHIGICKDEKTLYYISVPYTDMFGESYRNFYEKITRPHWRKHPCYTISKKNLTGNTLWKYLKYEARIFPHAYFFRRLKVRIDNLFYDFKKKS